MQIRFNDRFLGEVASKGYTGKLPFPVEVATKFRQRIIQIKNASHTQDLRNIKSLHFEKLKEKKYEGKYSIRINQAYRIIFSVDTENGNIEIICIEEISNHYS
ncbi:MAG TPA: addiction module killer protein [Sphingobacteriaceae bacterium]|nr:addiction module killer protein [Sphingobacteriaceae bacterium]